MKTNPEIVGPGAQDFDPAIVKEILDKFGRDDRYTKDARANLTLAQLRAGLSPRENGVIERLMSLKPRELGFLGPFVSIEDPPKDLVQLPKQVFHRDGEESAIKNQYLPRGVWQEFIKLKTAMKKDIGSDLMVESGYRSPAHQALVFLTYLEKFKFDIKYVASGVALPGHSQHGDPVNTAMDVINQDGVPDDEQPHLFAKTKEYAWLLKNAEGFSFYQSYPENNQWGVRFEPWHWQYRPE